MGSGEAGAARERAPAPRFRLAPGPPGDESETPGQVVDADEGSRGDAPGVLEGEVVTTPPDAAPDESHEDSAGPDAVEDVPLPIEAEALANEFDDFLADMGAEPVDPEESALAIKDATIEELQRNLERLRPLGDQLAEIEKARLALESELAEARLELARVHEEHHAELSAVLAERDKLERARARLEERVSKTREKFAKRDRVATERWHQIRALQQERRRLKDALKQLQRSPVDLGSGNAQGERPNLSGLFDPASESGPERPRTPEPAPEPPARDSLRS